MRGIWIPVLFILILILAVVFGAQSDTGSSDPDLDIPDRAERQPTNSALPLSPKHDTAIVAAPDGTVYLVEVGSGKILWSFSSGPSIYSSHQALPEHEDERLNASADSDNFYIDCGEDWELYLHGNGFKKMKLPLSAEEFIRRTPFVSAGGGVMLGSKKTAVFVVDAKTGNVLHTFRSDGPPSAEGKGVEESTVLARKADEEWVASSATELGSVEKPLYVTRTDYAMKYTSVKTGEVLWYLMFADIEASFQCDGIEKFLGGFSRRGDDFGLRDSVNGKLPMHCRTRPVVYRVRDRASLESLFMVNQSVAALPGGGYLPLPASDSNVVLEPVIELMSRRSNEVEMALALPNSETRELGIRALPGGKTGQMNSTVSSDSSALPPFRSFSLYAVVVPLIFTGLFYIHRALFRKQGKSYKQPEELKLQAVTVKKRKARKSGVNKSSVASEKKMKNILDGNAISVIKDAHDSKLTKRQLPVIFPDSHNGFEDGRRIGKLLVTNKEIAKGSNGTIVLEGIYDGRLVAVKRLVRTHHDVALKEIQNLIASDQHPNIVRWYGVEHDQDFVYLSLERCTCSLHELVLSYSASSQNITDFRDPDHDTFGSSKLQLQWNGGTNKDFQLWKSNGYPSAALLKVMRDVVSGLSHLHELGIIHRDLKPQNVLIIKERSLQAKLSDMGISKRLDGDMSSLTKHATGYGSSGWQAPEQLRHERQTRAVDLFSLGCVLFFCITGGKHPFGENLERDINIVNNQKDLFLIEHIPEATDLISRLLNPIPELRPKAVEILHHPLFWNSEMRLSFLRDASDRVELEDRENESEIFRALESTASVALGGKWDEKMDNTFINDIGRYRRYKFDSVRDLLRVIRNKLNHYRELSNEIQGLLGQVPDGFDSYFSNRFPKLLIEVYKVIHRYCAEEKIFRKYFSSY